MARQEYSSTEGPADAWVGNRYSEAVVDLRTLATIPAVPRRGLSRLAGSAARMPLPVGMRGRVWGMLAKRLGIDPSSVPGKLEDYPSFLSLFTRGLPEDSRPLPPGEDWLSPADGLLVASSQMRPEGTWLIKGVPYSTKELLCGASSRDLASYRALQIYLAPRDYHRYHAPCDMQIEAAYQQPGDLQPVDPVLVRRSMRVLLRNRRVLLRCRSLTDGTRFALLFVGAFNVGGMRFVFDRTLGQPPLSEGERLYQPPVVCERGGELGQFEFGSTVVLFTPPGLRPLVEEGDRVSARAPLFSTRPLVTGDEFHD